jgi:hypothetical protein
VLEADLPDFFKYVEGLLQATAKAVVAEFDVRLPKHELLNALRILHPRFFLEGGSFSNFEKSLNVLIDHFGTETTVGEERVKALVDAVLLREHAGWFFEHARHTAKTMFSKRKVEELQIGTLAGHEDDELLDLVHAMDMQGDEDNDSDNASEASSEGSAESSQDGEAAGRADVKTRTGSRASNSS